MTEKTSKSIIIALDTPDNRKVVQLIEDLQELVDGFKIDSALIYCPDGGPRFINSIHRILGRDHHKEIFCDIQIHNIPNRAAAIARKAVHLKPTMLSVHCLGGSAMMEAVREAIDDEAKRIEIETPKLFGVTLLSSHSSRAMKKVLPFQNGPGWLTEEVVNLAQLAQKAGLDGVYATAGEIRAIRRACGPDFLIASTAIRDGNQSHDDHERTVTPIEAIRAGANYLVVGRPVINARNPIKEVERLIAQIESV